MPAFIHDISRARTDIPRPFGVMGLLALIAVSLSACGGNAVPPGTTNAAYDSPGNVAVTEHSRPATWPKRPTGSPTGKTAAIPFVRIPSATLMGLSESGLETKIGTPEMIRGEGETRVWQYRSEHCSLDAFFFPETEGGPRHLRHMLARMRKGGEKISVQDCLDQIVRQQQKQG